MFALFTDGARRVMALSRQEAERLSHDYIGTEHILLGLVREGSGVAANVLGMLGADAGKLSAEVERLAKPMPGAVGPGQPPFDARAKRALEFAIEEARKLNREHVGTEHLLLGLLSVEDGLAAQVLMNLGLVLEEVRKEVLGFLGAGALPNEVPDYGSEKWAAYDRFTDRAEKVMALARDEAERLKHDYIGTEHILLGLAKEGCGVAANVLEALGVDLGQIRTEVEALVKPAPESLPKSSMPLTPRARKVLGYAIEEARTLKHNYVGTEHLLLGLLREEEGLAAQVLLNLGLTLDRIRAEVLEFLGAGPGATDSKAPPPPPSTAVPPPAFDPWANPLSRLTDGAQRALAAAREESERLQQDFLGTEHILLGLVREESVATKLLSESGASPEAIHAEVDRLVKPGLRIGAGDARPFTGMADRAIQYAAEAARGLRHPYLATEHLLLGLLREPESLAARALLNLGLRPADVAKKLVEKLTQGGA